MRQNPKTTIPSLLLLLLAISPPSSHSFSPFPTTTTTLRITSPIPTTTPSSQCSTGTTTINARNQQHPHRRRCFTVVRMVEGGEDDGGKEEDKVDVVSFDDAAQALRDEEDEARMGDRNEMADEERREFNAQASSFESMRAKIRSRTADLSIEKSVTTAEAIKAATDRALSGEASRASSPFSPDLSAFEDGSSPFSKSGGVGGDELDPEEILTDEQKAEIDEIGQMNYWQQAVAEFGFTKFPSGGEILKQAGLMVVIFAVTAAVILNVDEALRTQYTDWGLIPRVGETLDYSDLTLPEGFTDQMTEDDLANL